MSDELNNGVVMFFVGLGLGICLSYRWFKRSKLKATKIENETETETSPFGNSHDSGNIKLILIVRNDLKMGKGKVAAQCSHAAVMAHESSKNKQPGIFKRWKRNGQPKIVVKIESEEEMLDLAAKARSNDLVVSIVCDAGRTQVASGTRTVLAIGPGPQQVIDQLTGHLKLY